jgi:hypothetical protein
MALYEFFTSRNNGANAASFIGQAGRLFYDGSNGVVKLSDGATPGGTAIPYTIATENIIGGIKAGPGANVAVDGTLTIDTSGLPLSIGNLQIEDTTIKTLNVNDDLFLESNGTGNVVIIGDLNVYKTNGDISTRLPEFRITRDGQVRMIVANVDATAGAVSIVGNNDAVFQTPVNTGVMLQVTGQPNIPSRIYNDANGDYSGWVGRRYNGTSVGPTQVLANQEILRLVGNGYTSDGWKAAGSGRFVVAAAENQALNAQGGRLEFWATPVGQPGTNGQRVAYIDTTNGLVANLATITGNLTVNGNIVGNATTTTATIGELRVSGNVAFNANVNNAVTNGFNKAGGTAVANGRTGQITSLADIIAKGDAATFTITNSYITNKDVVIINIASGASINAYSVSVTAVNNGNCQVTVTNNGSGSLSQALVFNFAVIKVV